MLQRSVVRLLTTQRPLRSSWKMLKASRFCELVHIYSFDRAQTIDSDRYESHTSFNRHKGSVAVPEEPNRPSTGNNKLLEFSDAAERTLQRIHDTVESWAEDLGISEYDATFELGVVTISFGSKGAFVLNKQASIRELWLSSPVSGPSHYYYCPSTRLWRDTRQRTELLSRLEYDINHIILNGNLRFDK